MKCLQICVFSKILFSLWMCVCMIGVAQPRRLVECYRMNYVNSLPKELLATRSAVLVSVAYAANWKILAAEAQRVFASVGIDGVTYALQHQVYLGEEMFTQYTQQLHAREIQFVVLLDFLSPEKLVCTITHFSPTSLVEVEEGAWQRQTKNLETLRLALQQTINYQKVENQNFLINEYAEFSNPLAVKLKKKVYGLPNQFSRQYLAVAKWKGYCLADTCKCEAQMTQINQQIAQWFSEYYADRTYKIIDYSAYPKSLVTYEYVLFFLYGEEITDLFAPLQSPRSTSEEANWGLYIKHVPSNVVYYPSQGGQSLEQVLELLR